MGLNPGDPRPSCTKGCETALGCWLGRSLQPVRSTGDSSDTHDMLDGGADHPPMSEKYTHPRPEMLAYIPESAKSLLDVGCNSGGFGETVRKKLPHVRLVGIEPDPLAAAEASKVHDEVAQGLFPEAAIEHLAGERYDVIMFNDVLEHMAHPAEALAAAREFLADGGTVVASIPNVGHISVIAPLTLWGRWHYSDSGILDATHLRFFTRSTIQEFFDGAGWRLLKLEGINSMLHVGESGPRWWIKTLSRLTRGGSDRFFCIQYVAVAEPI
jgi:2-polyprenyl-3-methyl-5-hydroxy-6-metoxy-1,4-benzoquinol methylase